MEGEKSIKNMLVISGDDQLTEKKSQVKKEKTGRAGAGRAAQNLWVQVCRSEGGWNQRRGRLWQGHICRQGSGPEHIELKYSVAKEVGRARWESLMSHLSVMKLLEGSKLTEMGIWAALWSLRLLWKERTIGTKHRMLIWTRPVAVKLVHVRHYM